METLKLNARLRTEEPGVLLDPALPVGRYVVTLVVAGDRGESAPATVKFTVQRADVRPPVVGPVPPTPVEPVRPIPIPPVVRPPVVPSPVRDRTPPRTPGRKKPRRENPEE